MVGCNNSNKVYNKFLFIATFHHLSECVCYIRSAYYSIVLVLELGLDAIFWIVLELV